MRFKDMPLLRFGHSIMMVGAVYQGDGKNLVVLFPGESQDGAPFEPLDMDAGDWDALLQQTDLLQTEIMMRAKDGTVVKAMVRKCQRQIEQGVSWSVYRRDKFRCRYCGNNTVPLTVDHVLTWENESGPSIESNLVTCCRKDNKIRGEMPYTDWMVHPHYLQVSKRLDAETRQANLDLIDTLDQIPRRVHERGR